MVRATNSPTPTPAQLQNKLVIVGHQAGSWATSRQTQVVNLLPDMFVVGNYPARFEADFAVAMLRDAGITGIIIGDTTAETAGLGRIQRFAVAVHSDAAEDAAAVLAAESSGEAAAEIEVLDRQFHMHRFADRPTWVRLSTYTLLAAVVGPLLLAVLVQLGWLAGNLFP